MTYKLILVALFGVALVFIVCYVHSLDPAWYTVGLAGCGASLFLFVGVIATIGTAGDFLDSKEVRDAWEALCTKLLK